MIIRGNRQSKLTIRVGFTVAFWLGFVLVSPASGFQAGPNGAHGIDGDPGTRGGFGTAGVHIDTEFDETIYVQGSRGGNGGNGGLGIDGEDADQIARGGQAGVGGRGGAISFLNVIIDPAQLIVHYLSPSCFLAL